MSLQERSATERVQEARERYVARGISTPSLVVARAEGARIWDLDGREYIDFAGGLGCAEQIDGYIHQSFTVGMCEPYVRTE